MGTISKAMSKVAPQNTSAPEQEPQISADSQPKPSPTSEKKIQVDTSLFTDTQEGKIEDWDPRLKKVAQNPSLIAEEIRRVRNKILHPTNGKKIRSVLITSAIPGEGKSFICANLGISTALGVEKNAILVDCDLRRPTLAPMFGIENDTGLVNHLHWGTDLTQLIRKTGQDKLSVLPSGLPPANPSELLDSTKMTTLIDELSERYEDRLLFLDSPPMQIAAETAILAEHVDAVIVIVRWGHATQEQAQELVKTIGKDKILGIIFNAFETNVIESRFQKIKGQDKYYK
jgi:capsular exopolysaccharide synthesis family protein